MQIKLTIAEAKRVLKSTIHNLEALGCKVLDFQHNKRMPSGAVGWVDILVVRKKTLYFIEVKWDKDSYSEEQFALRDYLIRNRHQHLTVTEDNVINLLKFIMDNDTIFEPSDMVVLSTARQFHPQKKHIPK